MRLGAVLGLSWGHIEPNGATLDEVLCTTCMAVLKTSNAVIMSILYDRPAPLSWTTQDNEALFQLRHRNRVCVVKC